jgi:chemotaxis protein methyltransferase CheR
LDQVKQVFEDNEKARSLAQIIVDTVREPLLVLDGDLNIQFASTSFDQQFRIGGGSTRQQHLFALDKGIWDEPALRTLLEQTDGNNPGTVTVEVSRDFWGTGSRTLLMHARNVMHDGKYQNAILLSFEDITERRGIEKEKELLQKQTHDLLQQKDMLLQEMQHRIVNSLQIIASILLLKARAVTSEETRQHLRDAHRRVMSVAAVQQHLHISGSSDLIEIAPYLSKLCESLTQSMIGDSRPATLSVRSDDGKLSSADAVSLGLIVTELVINALKHAFPDQKASATVTVRYEVNGTDWKLSVSDNGIGKREGDETTRKGGLGTSLVNALANQLDAQVKTTSGPSGTDVAVTHATFTSRLVA